MTIIIIVDSFFIYIILEIKTKCNKLPERTIKKEINSVKNMGNTINNNNLTSSQPPKYIHTTSDKLVVQLRSRSIILHYGYKFSLNIGDVAMFPHGLSGLKLWQSNIVLARFVIMNHQWFKQKKVLELGAGTGIGGITVSKWTQCQNISMSDSREEVIRNMTKNCQRNIVKNIVIFRLNLTEYQLFTNKYDIILCSQILRSSPITLKQVYSLFKHFLNPNGSVFIIMSDNIQKIQQFSDLVNSQEFQFKYEKLVEEEYYASPLLNKVEGYKEFQRLQMEDYYVVRMRRKQQYQQKNVIKKILPKLPQKKQSENVSPIKQIQQSNQSPEQLQVVRKQQQQKQQQAQKEEPVVQQDDDDEFVYQEEVQVQQQVYQQIQQQEYQQQEDDDEDEDDDDDDDDDEDEDEDHHQLSQQHERVQQQQAQEQTSNQQQQQQENQPKEQQQQQPSKPTHEQTQQPEQQPQLFEQPLNQNQQN